MLWCCFLILLLDWPGWLLSLMLNKQCAGERTFRTKANRFLLRFCCQIQFNKLLHKLVINDGCALLYIGLLQKKNKRERRGGVEDMEFPGVLKKWQVEFPEVN